MKTFFLVIFCLLANCVFAQRMNGDWRGDIATPDGYKGQFDFAIHIRGQKCSREQIRVGSNQVKEKLVDLYVENDSICITFETKYKLTGKLVKGQLRCEYFNPFGVKRGDVILKKVGPGIINIKDDSNFKEEGGLLIY